MGLCISSNGEKTERNANSSMMSKQVSSSSNIDDINIKPCIERWLNQFEYLRTAQSWTTTKLGLKVCQSITPITITRDEVEVIRHEETASEQVRLIMNPPFSEITRITDHLFLTGVGGLTTENYQTLNIRLIMNVTYEMPLVMRDYLGSIRIPVDDDPEDDIYSFLDNAADFIQAANRDGIRTVVHCVAGASRSATIVIAYLVKHQQRSLKDAFSYVNAARECARPNMGFFRELIKFENKQRGNNSVRMAEFIVSGNKVRVPDFYKLEFPDLFQVEARKQMRKSDEVVSRRKPKKDQTNQNVSTNYDSEVNKCSNTVINNNINNNTNAKHATRQTKNSNRRHNKPHLRETFDEINQIRARSFCSKSSDHPCSSSSSTSNNRKH